MKLSPRTLKQLGRMRKWPKRIGKWFRLQGRAAALADYANRRATSRRAFVAGLGGPAGRAYGRAVKLESRGINRTAGLMGVGGLLAGGGAFLYGRAIDRRRTGKGGGRRS